MKEMIRMVATLTVLCCVSGAVLSYLKIFTAPLIEAQEIAMVQGPAIKSLFPKYTNNPVVERKSFEIDGGNVVVFPIKENGTLVGVAFEQLSAGYGGPLGAMVGFSIQTDTIVGVQVTAFRETPGYGTKVYENSFRDQFINLKASNSFADVKRISGATVSSTAFIEDVKKASTIYTKLKPTFVEDFKS